MAHTISVNSEIRSIYLRENGPMNATDRSSEGSASCSVRDQKQLAHLCKALAHPIRVEIIKILLDEGTCISGDLAGAFNKAHSTVSEHLKILKDAGLVLGTIDGPKRSYCVNPEALKQMKLLLNRLIFDPECCQIGEETGELHGDV